MVRLDAALAAPFGGHAAGELVLANVFHDGGFWVAHVPLDDVEAVLFQLEDFPAIVLAGRWAVKLEAGAGAITTTATFE